MGTWFLTGGSLRTGKIRRVEGVKSPDGKTVEYQRRGKYYACCARVGFTAFESYLDAIVEVHRMRDEEVHRLEEKINKLKALVVGEY